MPSGSAITIPAYPPAPSSFEFSSNEIAGTTVSIFTGQQNIYDWGTGPDQISVSWPPMTAAQAADWKTFLVALKGQVNYFAFSTAFTTAYPEFASKNWRLTGNEVKWEVAGDRMYRVTFEARLA